MPYKDPQHPCPYDAFVSLTFSPFVPPLNAYPESRPLPIEDTMGCNGFIEVKLGSMHGETVGCLVLSKR